MKIQILPVLLLFCLPFYSTAQLEFLEEKKAFTDKKSGFDPADLINTVLLVEAFEPISPNCRNKPVLLEVNLGLVPAYFCPSKDMTKRDKKDVEKFNKKIDKKISTQEKLWKNYKRNYELVPSEDIGSVDYEDTDKYRFVLKYNYAVSSTGFANSNTNRDWSYHYFLYDRKLDKEYSTVKNRSTITNLKKLSNLSGVIKNLEKG